MKLENTCSVPDCVRKDFNLEIPAFDVHLCAYHSPLFVTAVLSMHARYGLAQMAATAPFFAASLSSEELEIAAIHAITSEIVNRLADKPKRKGTL